MSKRIDTPEYLEWWKNNNSSGSRFVKVIPSWAYNPEPKTMSRRDRHRMQVRLYGRSGVKNLRSWK